MIVPSKPFQPGLVIVSKARNPPSSGALEIFFTQVGSGLTCKHLTRLEGLARDKHSSSLQKSVNYGSNKCYDTGPRPNVIFLTNLKADLDSQFQRTISHYSGAFV